MRIPVTIFAVLLAFQANAQTENKITVSGRAWGSVENVSVRTPTTGAPINQRFRVTNDSSFVRIRGDMKLSQDLSAWGQVEVQFALDGSTTNAVPFDSGRNTAVGFTSKTFGSISAGRWDSPYKLAVIRLDPWANTTILNYAAIMGQLSQGGNIYDARLGNTVQYWSPVFQGLQAKVAVMTNEDKAAGSQATNPHVLSASVTYDGPIYVGVAYETRKNCSNANGQGAPICGGPLLVAAGHGRDWGARAGAGYNFKPSHSEVGVIWERLESSADFAAAPSPRTLKRDAYYVSLVQGILGDAHQFVGAFGLAAKAKGDFLATNDKTGATYWTASYRYNFNKDLFVHAGYIQIKNDDNATYRFGSSGLLAAQNLIGGTYSGWVVGTRYLF